MQSILTPEDQMIKAIQELRNVLQRNKNKKSEVDFDSIKALSKILRAGESKNQRETEQAPRVQKATERQAAPNN